MKNRFKETTIYKNKNGKIIKTEDQKFGGTRYTLHDPNGNFVKELFVPFRVGDYL